MKKSENFLALDFGASTGRGIIGCFDGNKLSLEEIHRFTNYFVDLNGTYYWDVLRMFHEILSAMQTAHKGLAGKQLYSIGIDTWGTDYGLIAQDGQLLGNPRCMRNADGTWVKEVQKVISSEAMFEHTGIQVIYGNTAFQLFERLKSNDSALMGADKMLMMPDLLAYFLTGVKKSEYTMATTSMLFNPTLRNWDFGLIQMLGLPEHIFPEILYPTNDTFNILEPLQRETGFSCLRYAPVGTHDTASAVAAIPLEEDEAFCSSGTWSLFGVETPSALLSPEVYQANFSNEGTIDGRYRLLKNIMGMWILQECSREWRQTSGGMNWDEIVHAAKQSPAFRSFVNTDEPAFYNAGNMTSKIKEYCRKTNQAIPETTGDIARCIYESIALRYRMTMDQLEKILGRGLKALRIVGGGAQNNLLNQFAANAIQRPVYTGPVEAACAGNILAQGITKGEVGSLRELREIVKNSFNINTYLPEDKEAWDEAYGRYRDIIVNNSVVI